MSHTSAGGVQPAPPQRAFGDDVDALTGTHILRVDARRGTHACRGHQALGAAALAIVEHGHGASELQRAVTETELKLPRLIADYQDAAATRGEVKAQLSKLPKILKLLNTGISTAELALTAARETSTLSAASSIVVDEEANPEAELAQQRLDRYRAWLCAITDMAAANKPTPLTRLEMQSRRGGEPWFCSTLDAHAKRLQLAHEAGTPT